MLTKQFQLQIQSYLLLQVVFRIFLAFRLPHPEFRIIANNVQPESHYALLDLEKILIRKICVHHSVQDVEKMDEEDEEDISRTITVQYRVTQGRSIRNVFITQLNICNGAILQNTFNANKKSWLFESSFFWGTVSLTSSSYFKNN